jgi:CRISPR-associated protein Cas1
LSRSDNTLKLEPRGEGAQHERPGADIAREWASEFPLQEEDAWWLGTPKHIPVERISDIHAFVPVDLNADLLQFLAAHDINFHLYNYYGGYTGSFHKRPSLPNGKLLRKQVLLAENEPERVRIARELLRGTFHNMRRSLTYYVRRQELDQSWIEGWDQRLKGFERPKSIQELMGQEGTMRSLFYKALDALMEKPFQIEMREYHPPTNPANAMISFLNSLMYTTVLSEIYRTQLNPLIGILHEGGRQNYPLAYDLSELFKPLLVESLILSMVRKKQIKPDDFIREANACLLNDTGRYKVTRAFESRLRTTIEHRKLGRNVSYRYLIRLECYKLAKYLLEGEPYEAFTLWW